MEEGEQRRLWERVIRRAGLRYRSPKQLRHTFVSQLLSRGAPPLYVAAQTGHSPAVMWQYYAKQVDQERVVDATGRNLRATKGTERQN